MNKKIVFKIAICLFIGILYTSCGRMLYDTAYNKNFVENRFQMQKEGKEIVYVPITLIGKAPYYEQVKEFLDQKRKEGYTIYYENIALPEGLSQEEQDILQRKQRRLLSYHEEFFSKLPESKRKWQRKYTLRKWEKIGIQPQDICADLDQKSLIERYEAKYGNIPLTDCDRNTPLNESYKCLDRTGKSFVYTQTLRNEYLLERLENASQQKIVLVYGDRNRWFIAPELKKMGYQITYGSYHKL